LAIVTVGTVALAGCPAPRWRTVAPAVYAYRAPITAYAPGDAGLWVITARGASPEARAALARDLAEPDDVLGDGFVAWLDAAAVAAWRARADVAAVVPLQPAERIAAPVAAAAAGERLAIRVELAAAATDAQRDAVVAWLAARGARATAPGARTLDVELAASLARSLATLGPVRWVERRALP
jgi:hypothetical protein